MQAISLGGHPFGDTDFLLVAGPCVLESKALAFQIAESLLEMVANKPVTLVFKASYDKANRSSGESFRGPGLEDGLAILQELKEKLGLLVLSDVHEAREIPLASTVLDVIQIPAFLCRQTSLLTAAAQTQKAVNIKKGQFLAPWDMEQVLAKVRGINPNILVTERGTSFGYNNLVVDMRSLAIMGQWQVPVLFDATHSVQLPGGGRQSGGNREFIPVLARAAVAAGINGLFLETHPNPEHALSDSASMLPLDDLPKLLQDVLSLHDLRKAMAG